MEQSRNLVKKWKKRVIDSSSEVGKQPECKKRAVEKKPLQVYFYRPNIKKFSESTAIIALSLFSSAVVMNFSKSTAIITLILF